MKRLIIIIQILMLCTCTALYAQKKSVTVAGTVLDPAMQNEPLIGVNVYIKDKPGVGTSTDVDGKFQIKAEIGDVLIFSYMGYENYEYPIKKNESTVVIQMQTASVQLEEAVVVGMGKQRKIGISSAITSVDVSQLQVPATSLNNMLGGRVAGVISLQSSGEPGKNISEFWVRGIGTFGANSSALVLIDGLEGRLSDVDPADVESFSILKDASATAVYGVRGANGVVLVTTKRGQTDRLRVTARVNFTVSQLKHLPEFVRSYDYAKLANEARVVSDMSPLYSDMDLNLIKYHMDPDLFPDVDWQNEILNKTSLQQTYYISAQGGGNVAKYFISLNMSNEGAAYKQDPNSKYKSDVGYRTYGYRSNLDINVTKTTSLYFGVDGFISSTGRPGGMTTDNIWYQQANLTSLTIPTMYSGGVYPCYDQDLFSPYVLLNATGMGKDEEFKNMATLALNQDLSMITPGLKIRVQGALNTTMKKNELRFLFPEMYNATERDVNGELKLIKKRDAQAVLYGEDKYFWRKLHFETMVNYERLIADDHRITGLLYYYMSDEGDTGYKAEESLKAIPRRYQGVSSRITYGLKDTYFLDVNFGYTGSENFQPGKQFGFFPSVSLGWVPSQYKFVQEKLPWLSFLKIRGSYGTVGNDRITDKRFPYLTQMNSIADTGWGAGMIGVSESVMGSDNLKWERAIKANIGVEGKLFNEKVDFVVDFFNDQRNGIFQQRTNIPDYVGIPVGFPFGNVGKMRSYGSDGNISFTQTIGKDFYFTLRGNYTYSSNEVKEWEENNLPYEYLFRRGWPHNVRRGFIALGLFKDEDDVKYSPSQFGTLRPGDIKYKDVDGNGVINDDDMVPLAFDNYPRFMYGFGGEFTYKNWTLNVLFKGTGRVDIFRTGIKDGNQRLNDEGWIPFNAGKTGNVLTLVADQKNRWTPASYSGDPSTENPDAMFPRLTYGRNENNAKLSTFWRDNARYLRMEEIGLTYKMRAGKFLKQLGVSSLDFQVIGYNLAVWSSLKVKMYDPEQTERNGQSYPIPARYAAQLYVNF
ncbi:SusC/RagA family TonB-linked outer membrane protein [Parabacteroides pacaensis]|uniref:SusC/RagA family TonB-linked outer membrane protein n=1 Tax=Parabacteroides pacaensis TaxID=2086575 RepID=UPI000D0ED46E|nr:TonB-dependent receptor [Parabacteroides pacaensis]